MPNFQYTPTVLTPQMCETRGGNIKIRDSEVKICFMRIYFRNFAPHFTSQDYATTKNQ